MASPCEFVVHEHTLPAQHIREYDHGVADENEDYYIHIKQYSPKLARQPQEDDVTIIAAAGIGMVKEIYEPFFQILTSKCMERGVFIRNVWIADMGCVGKSAIVNARNLSHDQNWFDHSRDLLAMVNHFRKQIPRPIVGFGHSMGGCQIAHLATLHPNLFHSLILIEPAIWKGLAPPATLANARVMSRRKEYWPTRAEAEKGITQNPFFKHWHPRVISLLIENSFAKPEQLPIPTPKEKDEKATDPVVSTTPRTMEVALSLRPNYSADSTAQDLKRDRVSAPDVDPDARMNFPFYRGEPIAMLKALPKLRPSVCYIVGDKSHICWPEVRKERLEVTGTGVGGSGGAKMGRVVERVVKGGNHYPLFDEASMEAVGGFAGDWLEGEMGRWRMDRERRMKGWREMRVEEKVRVDGVMVEALGEWHPKKKPDIVALVKARL
jgi:pimeloyl-ACP methyl ester carboxylesterase